MEEEDDAERNKLRQIKKDEIASFFKRIFKKIESNRKQRE
jgi:hypothetical protein